MEILAQIDHLQTLLHWTGTSICAQGVCTWRFLFNFILPGNEPARWGICQGEMALSPLLNSYCTRIQVEFTVVIELRGKARSKCFYMEDTINYNAVLPKGCCTRDGAKWVLTIKRGRPRMKCGPNPQTSSLDVLRSH